PRARRIVRCGERAPSQLPGSARDHRLPWPRTPIDSPGSGQLPLRRPYRTKRRALSPRERSPPADDKAATARSNEASCTARPECIDTAPLARAGTDLVRSQASSEVGRTAGDVDPRVLAQRPTVTPRGGSSRSVATPLVTVIQTMADPGQDASRTSA